MAIKRSKKTILLILGDQLFPVKYIRQINPTWVFMAEDEGLCRQVKHHKQKIIMYFGAMRHYAKELKNKEFNVIYEKFCPGSIFSKLKTQSKRLGIECIQHFSIEDTRCRRDFLQEFTSYQVIEHASPKFLTTSNEFSAYLKGRKKPFMKTFYEWSRNHLDILMEKGKPLGGKYSFDEENRKKIPKSLVIPTRKIKQQSLDSIKTLVNKEFSDHPGSTSSLFWPITRAEYLLYIDQFIKQFLEKFGPYQDALSTTDPFLFHSLLSPGLNMGLITPKDILDKLLKLPISNHVLLTSVEGYVRQLIGWREFVKGIYDHFQHQMETTNYWKSNRQLKACWWEGNTGLDPVDDVIKKCQTYGYAHHIERLMVMANVFNLIEAKPIHVYQWFMEMSVDSADWVMQANVYGMGLMSDGGIFATKPYVCGSNYILKMSHYKKGPWCDIMDGLYWRFIKKHREYFIKQPRMSMMVRMLDKISKEKYSRISKAAVGFIERTTTM